MKDGKSRRKQRLVRRSRTYSAAEIAAETIARLEKQRRAHPQPPTEPASFNGKRIVATYDYVDKDGKLLYQVVRFEPKTFCHRRPDGRGGRIWNLAGVESVPYHLPELLASKQPIFIVEGEKDADHLVSVGLTATTNAGGAKNWQPELAKYFAGKEVVILPDNDRPGRQHAEEVAGSVFLFAHSVKLIFLPNLKEEGEDISDWLDKGYSKEELLSIVAQAPYWQPTEKAEALQERPHQAQPGRTSRAAKIAALVPMPKLLAALGFEVNERTMRSRCLLHGGSNPTSFQWREDGRWHCHACGRGGNKIELLKAVRNCTVKQALEGLAVIAGIRLPDRISRGS